MSKKVALMWYCRTPKGWRRFPVVMGGNNRIKHGFVLQDGKQVHYPEGRYEIRTYKDRKKVYKRAGDNAADAMAARDREAHLEDAKVSAEAAGVKVIEEAGRMNLRRAALKFEEDALDRGAMEAAEVNRLVMDEFIAVTGLTFVDEITREQVLRFHKELRKRGLSDRTVHNKHMRLRSFCIFCKLPYKEFMPPTPRFDKTLPPIYTREEIGKILAVAGEYMKMAIELGLKCGLREQEIMHVEWSDIHWDESILRVASKPRWEFKVKDSEERDIPIPADLLKHLKDYKKKHPESKLILPTKNGLPNKKLLRTLKRLAKNHGLNCGHCEGCQSKLQECGEWFLHKFRYTYCTTMLQSGIDVATVQAYMGHADLETTMRYLRPASAKESQAKVNAIKWT